MVQKTPRTAKLMPMNTRPPQTGCFLLANEPLQGSYFENRVVFLADHSPQGSFGLILNAPVHMPLEEVFSGLRSRERKPFPFFVGGPVQEEGIHILETSYSAIPNALEVVPGVFLSEMGPEQPIPVLDLFAVKTTRICLGYSGWASGQLDSEIATGCWEVVTPPPLEVLARDRDAYYPTPVDFKRLFVLY